MTSNKPEPVAWMTHHDEPMLLPNRKEAAAYCEDGEEPVALVRLSDYEALQSECEKLRKDAERYRWLREAHTAHPINLTICSANDWGLKPWSGDDPDAAIDAAMEKQK